jgi:hypothetical protein
MAERKVFTDPNAPNVGSAPAQQLAVQGIMSPRAAPRSDQSLTSAIEAFGGAATKMNQKRKAADFIDGQMASMSGKTQAEVAASGNRTTMAGYVGLEVSNAVSEWGNAQQQAASDKHYATDPAAYNKLLAEQAATLITEVGDDDYAQEVLAKSLAPTMQRLAAAQSGAHASYVEQETINSYTNGLFLSGQYSAGAYQDPTSGTVSKGGDYRSFANDLLGTLIGVESGNNPTAKNSQSSAEGLGQFIDSTWLATVKRYSPHIAAGKSDSELLGMKTNPLLSRRMALEYAAEQARGLAAAGLPVTRGNTYLAYFAGPGGAKRVLQGDPNASVATTLTQRQINANKSVVYKGGKLITNAELGAWAARKMGASAAPSSATRTAALTNPGIAPDKHRAAVTAAVVSSLQSGDQSLFQSVGGIEGLQELNLTLQQQNSIRTAQKQAIDKAQNEYNLDYERSRHNLLSEAASGKFSEEEMFTKLTEFYGENGLSDAEKRRLHTQMQSEIDAEGAATSTADAKAAGEAADGAWDTIDAQIELITYKEAVRNGAMTADAAMAEIIEVGALRGASPEATEKAVAKILGVYETVKGKERTRLEKAIADGQKTRETQSAAARLLGSNALGTGTKQERDAGIALMEATLKEDLADLPPQEQAEKGQALLAQAMVQNDLVDDKRASTMRSAMISPVGPNGEPTAAAIQAMSFFMDLKHGGNASPEYLAKMFKGQEKTLETFLTAEQHMIGDASMDDAIAKAHEQINNPVTQARIREANKAVDSGDLQNRVKEQIISASGLENTFWNRVLNTGNTDWKRRTLSDKDQQALMDDVGLGMVIDQEARSAIALYPNASSDTIAQIVSGQVAERGALLGKSFVLAPDGKTIAGVMGLNSVHADDQHLAVQRFVEVHGRELFGEAVWEDFGSAFGGAGLGTAIDLAVGSRIRNQTKDGMRRDTGFASPDFSVELIGDMFRITPVNAAFEDDVLFDDFSSLPEAQSVIVPAAEIGTWFNANQTAATGSLTNSAIDLLKPVSDFEGKNSSQPMRWIP